MTMTRLAPLVTALIMACNNAGAGPAVSLVQSYPYDGQAEVPTGMTAALRFSRPITGAAGVTLETADGDPVPFTAETVNEGRGLLSVGLDLEIPEGGLTLTYTQHPVRE